VEGSDQRAGRLILGLETSCDETAAAVVTQDGRILSNIVSSQAELHARFGGVVPEVASRRHLELVVPVLREALAEADTRFEDLDAVAVTHGPGLVGALLVGLSAAKAVAWANGLPLIPVNHLHGHVASLYLQPEPVEPPFLCLLASGGHTLLIDVPEHGAFRVLGTTPPKRACSSACEETMLERIRPSCVTTAAAVSSHDVSIPRISRPAR
jgi:N6-L-threonylcarbamoyladenine synthase